MNDNPIYWQKWYLGDPTLATEEESTGFYWLPSFSAFTKIFFNFCLWGVVSFTFHCQLSSRFIYKLKRTRLYGKLVNNITVWEFDCLSNAVGNEKIEKYFTKFFVNLTKLLKLKPRYAGNPRKMPETVSSGEDSFASRWRL